MDKNEITRLVTDLIKQNARDNRYRNTYINTTHNGMDGPILPYLLLNKSVLTVSGTTNGTTVVNLFSAFGSPFNMTVTGVFLVSQDTTAGNITLKVGGSTIVTIAKGTVSGAMVGGVSLANTTIVKGNAFTIVSSSGGNATVFVNFKVTS